MGKFEYLFSDITDAPFICGKMLKKCKCILSFDFYLQYSDLKVKKNKQTKKEYFCFLRITMRMCKGSIFSPTQSAML